MTTTPTLRGNLTADQQARLDALITWVAEQRKTNPKMSEAALCRSAHISQPLWSVLKQGKYTQPSQNTAHIEKLERARKTIETAQAAEPVKTAAEAVFLETETYRLVRASVEASLQLAETGSELKLTMLAAPSRHGKTTISKKLEKEFTGLACNALRDWKMSHRCMMEDIAKKLGIAVKKSMRSYEIGRAIRAYFSTPKLLILNELGPHTVSGGMIAWIRELLNDTKAVILLCAVPELLDVLAASMKDELEQVECRGRLIRSKPITQGDVQWFFVRGQGPISPDACARIAAAANEFGGFSMVSTLAKLDVRLDLPDVAAKAASDWRAGRHIEPKRRPAARR